MQLLLLALVALVAAVLVGKAALVSAELPIQEVVVVDATAGVLAAPVAPASSS
jgi:hypothetical protein